MARINRFYVDHWVSASGGGGDSYDLDQAIARAKVNIEQAGLTPDEYFEFGGDATLIDPRIIFARNTTAANSTHSSWFIRDDAFKTASKNEPILTGDALRMYPAMTNIIAPSLAAVSGVMLGNIYGYVSQIKDTKSVTWETGAGLYNGIHVVQMASTAGVNTGQVFGFNIQGTHRETPNKNYTIGCWGRMEGASVTSEMYWLSTSLLPKLDSTWQFYTKTYDSGGTPGNLSLNVRFAPYNNPFAMQWGHITVVRGNHSPDAPIPNISTSDSLTRVADNASFAYSPGSSGAIVIHAAKCYFTYDGVANNMFRLSDQIAVRRDADGFLYLVRDGESDVKITNTNQNENNIGLKWGSGTVDVWANGNKELSAQTMPSGTISSLVLGDADSAGTFLNRVRIYNTPPSDANMGTLTTV